MDLLQFLIAPYEPTKPTETPLTPSSSQQPPNMASILIDESWEGEAHTQPAPLRTSLQPSPLSNVISIEDFERQHHEQALLDAQLRPSHSQLHSSRRSVDASNGSTTTTSTLTSSADVPVPVPLGQPRTTEHVKQFHELCQEKGIVPRFEFEEVGKQEGFGVKLSFRDQLLEERGPFRSKKEAKERVAERGVGVVRGMAREGVEKGKGGVDGGADGGVDKRENWVGMLLEYSNALSTPAPRYQDYAVGTKFACEVTLDERPAEPFGGKDKLFNSKKAAKTSAARDAVLWLREQGRMDGKGPPRKKAKINGAAVAVALGTGNGSVEGKEKSFAQQVNELCPILGLAQCEYRFQPDPRAPGFLSGAAYFPQDPLIGGPIGAVRCVFGKKAAKEECAKGVLEVLRGVQRQRMEMAERVIRERDEAMKAGS